ncbi:hypothetical protein A2U01_0069166, partial [Trifolium medium]|nr:hypothetical protein [Trifolium medium]
IGSEIGFSEVGGSEDSTSIASGEDSTSGSGLSFSESGVLMT